MKPNKSLYQTHVMMRVFKSRWLVEYYQCGYAINPSAITLVNQAVYLILIGAFYSLLTFTGLDGLVEFFFLVENDTHA
jgi:hypothetical protein